MVINAGRAIVLKHEQTSTMGVFIQMITGIGYEVVIYHRLGGDSKRLERTIRTDTMSEAETAFDAAWRSLCISEAEHVLGCR